MPELKARKFINLEPTWEACARIYIELVEHPKDAEARQAGVKGLMEMAEKLDALRQEQKNREHIQGD